MIIDGIGFVLVISEKFHGWKSLSNKVFNKDSTSLIENIVRAIEADIIREILPMFGLYVGKIKILESLAVTGIVGNEGYTLRQVRFMVTILILILMVNDKRNRIKMTLFSRQ